MKLIHGEALEEMQKMIDKGVKVDCIITDPPYRSLPGGSNIDKGYKNPSGMLSPNDGKFFKHNDIKFDTWLPMCYEILNDNSHAYFMTNFKNLQEMMRAVEKAGFKIHNLLVWQKNNSTPNRWYMKNVEYTIFARKGKAKSINLPGSKTCHSFNNYTNGSKVHPTQKPIDLMALYVENSSNVNEIVFDPFMGSGSTGVACKNLNRDFIGIELDEQYYNVAKERLGGK